MLKLNALAKEEEGTAIERKQQNESGKKTNKNKNIQKKKWNATYTLSVLVLFLSLIRRKETEGPAAD